MKTKTKLTNILLISFILSIFTACKTNSHSEKLSLEKPNIIFIMADDMGYGEAGCYGQEIIKTPNIDKIAAEGMKFTQFYSGQAVCAPARCSLLTGYHMGHSYIRNNGRPKEKNPITPFPGQNPIPDSVLTIGEILQQNGYITAAIGKWGLGNTGTSGDPNNQGFDLFYGYKCQVHAHNHYPSFLWRNDKMEQIEGNDGKLLRGTRHSQDLFTKEALSFINKNKDHPFFLYLPFVIPHLSIQTTDKFLNMYNVKIPKISYIT
ncbi:MAG: sulfatase-like hydrolase/transferase [Bacteroidales bacterium]|nr:sulfatase-like hydrolase/transferase [Bacteroidales bacterium]